MPPPLANRIAYIPPQCFTKMRAPNGGRANNPCYPCHTRSQEPNFTNDGDLQIKLSLPAAAAINPWTNLFDPPVLHTALGDEQVLAYVRKSNYFGPAGEIALRGVLAALPAGWDSDGDGRWDGYTPDVWFSFDDRGFDREPDGTPSGWRAYAYYPFPGTFFPTNGSADDALIRLPAVLQEDAGGRFDRAVYEINLAVVEALVTRSDVPIDPADESALGVDLDLDGRLGVATRVAFDAGDESKTRMRYVGLAHANEAKGVRVPIAPGLFPVGTELFHTVRYLDVRADGTVGMAARMKEVRYARKVRWTSYERARKAVTTEADEQRRSPDGVHAVHWAGDRGIAVGGWLYQGFIEDRDGSLRPQSFEESAYCEGCHGGVGATTDSTFSFARKMDARAPARGWFHWSQHGLHDVAEPRRSDGAYEYTMYLQQAGGGDELRANAEVVGRFFDERHVLRPAALRQLHRDISYLLLPSAARAIDLDRAYWAIVQAQSFDKGRDAVLSPSENVYAEPPIGAPTGVVTAVEQENLARPPPRSITMR